MQALPGFPQLCHQFTSPVWPCTAGCPGPIRTSASVPSCWALVALRVQAALDRVKLIPGWVARWPKASQLKTSTAWSKRAETQSNSVFHLGPACHSSLLIWQHCHSCKCSIYIRWILVHSTPHTRLNREEMRDGLHKPVVSIHTVRSHAPNIQSPQFML